MKLDDVLAAKLAPLLAAVPQADLELVVGMMVLVAHADSRIDDAEAGALRGGLETIVGSRLSALAVRTLVGGALADIEAVGRDEYAERLGIELGRSGSGEDAYRVAALIALSSENISADERRYLGILGRAAGVDAARMEALDAEARGALRA